MANEEELLSRLERWLAGRPSPPSVFEVIETGDGELLAAYVLKAFRAAAAEAVAERLQREGQAMFPTSSAGISGAAVRVLDGLARAWSLTDAEQLELLGLEDAADLKVFRSTPVEELPPQLLERLAILLDTFKAINTILPVAHQADAWIRKPNAATAFGGRSALDVMRSGLDAMRMVRNYLQAQL